MLENYCAATVEKLVRKNDCGIIARLPLRNYCAELLLRIIFHAELHMLKDTVGELLRGTIGEK
jgi:hypothetical protein